MHGDVQRMDVPAALEQSRSGRGGHVWLFLEDAVSAGLARKPGSHILTETMEARHRVDARAQAAARPFEHTVLVRPMAFQSAKETRPDKRVQFQAEHLDRFEREPAGKVAHVTHSF